MAVDVLVRSEKFRTQRVNLEWGFVREKQNRDIFYWHELS